MEIQSYYLWLGTIFGFMMAWGIGANDVANAMGTSVGSKAITIRQAILIAVVFEFSGSFLAGGEVANTIREGIIYTDPFIDQPKILIIGMLASLLASAVWLFVATHYGWPVSTTHAIIGAIVGFSAIGVGMDSVQWGNVGYIALSWLLSPILGGIIAYALFMRVQYFIFTQKDPIASAKKAVPFYMMFSGWVVTMVTLDQGIKNLGFDLSFGKSFLYSLPISLILFFVGKWAVRRLALDPSADRKFHFTNVERIFGILMIFTGCAMAFAHGSNDVANAIGPVAAIAHAVTFQGDILKTSPIPVWILLLGSMGIVIGLATYGHKVIATVGAGITELTPSRGFAATLSAAATVVLASGAGLPISTTHTLVGAVLGIGMAKGIHALNLSVISTIFMSWIVTLPAGAILSIIFFVILKRILL